MRCSISVAVIALGSSVVLAQDFLPPGVGTDAYGNYTSAHTTGIYNNPTSAFLAGEIQKNMNQQMIMNNMISNMIFAEMVKEEIYKEEGRKRLAAGKATTRFVPSADAVTIDARISRDAAPESVEKTRSAARASLDDFNKQMKARGYDIHDVADAKALAFCMAYTAHKGEDPGPARMQSLREKFRDQMMKSELWQGYAEHERQAEYENVAIPSMMAITARAASTAKDVPDDQRAGFERAAKELAEPVLRQFVPFPIDSLELTADGVGDRGERLAQSGLGTTTFNRVEPFITVRDYSMRWGFLNKPAGYWEQAISRFDAVVQAAGGSPTDVADANAAAFAIHYFVQSEGAVELSRAQVEWVRGEMRKDVLGSIDYQRMSDAERQRVYEGLALEAIRIRDDFHEQERVMALPKPEEAFAAYAHATNQSFARDSRSRDIASSRVKCKEIFQPRKLEEFVLVENGFAPIGHEGFITRQPAPAGAPAVAGFTGDGQMPEPHPDPAASTKPTTTPLPASTPDVVSGQVPVQATSSFIRNPECLTLGEFVGNHGEYASTAEDVEALLGEFDAEVEAREGRMTDIADAKATAYIALYELDAEEELTEAQTAGTREYFHRIAVSSVEVQHWNDARRQQAYERIGIGAMILCRRFEDAPEVTDRLKAQRDRFIDALLAPANRSSVRMTATGLSSR